MFTIWNEFGIQEPYWGNVNRVEAINALANLYDQSKKKSLWKLRKEELRSQEKISQVRNYRFVKEQREDSREEKEAPLITALQIMSFPVITLQPESLLEEAWDIIHKTCFHHIPIVNQDNILVGILSDRTVMATYHKLGGNVLVKEVMTPKVFSTTPETPIRRIAQLFVIERIGSMPIIDEAGKLVGIITRSDILRAFIGHL